MAEQDLSMKIESLIAKHYSGVGHNTLILALMRNHPSDHFSLTVINEALENLTKDKRIYFGRSNRYHIGYERQN